MTNRQITEMMRDIAPRFRQKADARAEAVKAMQAASAGSREKEMYKEESVMGKKTRIVLRAVLTTGVAAACAVSGVMLWNSRPKTDLPEVRSSMPEVGMAVSDAETSAPQPVQTADAKPLTAFLDEQNYNPFFEATDEKTLVYASENIGTTEEPVLRYTIAVYDSSSGTLSETVSSDIMPQCRANGFWVLKSAEDRTGTMRLMGQKQAFHCMDTEYFTDLLMYDYDMNLIADVDLTGYGTVHAIEADPGDGTVYTVQDNVQGWSLLQRSADTAAVTELLSSDTANDIADIHDMILCGDTMTFAGAVPAAAGNTPDTPAWGVIDCKTGACSVQDSGSFSAMLSAAKNCTYVTLNYDQGSRTFACRRVSADSTVRELTLTQETEAAPFSFAVSSSGEYCAVIRCTFGGRSSILGVCDKDGQSVMQTESEDGQVVYDIYIDESSRKLLAWTELGWKEFAF